MRDLDTDFPPLYVMADAFCQSYQSDQEHSPGRPAAWQCSEVITLALFGQWLQFPSERAFYRYALRHLRAAFPDLPDRGQVNRLLRSPRDAITEFALHLVGLMQAQDCLYEVLESTASVTRDAKRRGAGGLPGQADIGWSHRIGWYEGFHLLLSVTPIGVITGLGFGAASTHEQPLAETLFAVRQMPSPQLLSAGWPAHGCYVADKGFAGETPHQLAAKVGWHNFCIWLNLHLGRAPLAFAELLDW
jgi:hypothetical protein